MSFDCYKKTVGVGDTVVLLLGYNNMLQFTIEQDKIHQTRYGSLRHNDLVGVEFGSKVQCSKGYAHILHPTPELWTQTLPHRTQILYSTDISYITLLLDLKPGCVVVESGTGSGSLSHALLRTITPGGYLHTFDFHQQRVEKAAAEFKDHGFSSSVSVRHRDVLTEGFDLENVADAVFLDLPSPWTAMPHAKKTLKTTGGRLCSFSPCIEQVQRVCASLLELGFTEIQTNECLARTFDVKTVNMPVAYLGHPHNSELNLKGSIPGEDRGGSNHHPVIGKIELGELSDQARRKRHKGHPKGKGFGKGSGKGLVKEEGEDEKEGVGEQKEGESWPKKWNVDRDVASYVFKSGLTPIQMPGHTGYLTFATLYP